MMMNILDGQTVALVLPGGGKVYLYAEKQETCSKLIVNSEFGDSHVFYVNHAMPVSRT